MNKATFDGFVKRAQEAGLSAIEATNLFKEATGMDPAAMAGAGGPPPQGAGGPPPGHPAHGGHPGGGQPPIDASGGTGVPPELEQIIQQLPPEALQQLIQEIEAEMANGGQGGGEPAGHPAHGGHPAGGPPQGGGADEAALAAAMGKQGSVILAKKAGYVEGFVERGLSYGFSREDVKDMYKKALAIMEPTSQVKVASAPAPAQSSNAHYEGFIGQARAYGISDKEANEVYQRTFGK